MRSLVLVFLLLLMPASPVFAQELQSLGLGLRKISGVEPTQQIAFARIFLDGSMVAPGSPARSEALPDTDKQPVLIAQCTKAASGKMRFELMMNFGGITDTAYHPPWKSTGPDDRFPPHTEKTAMIFDFFGYTKVKPIKRSWEIQLNPYGELRYDPPGKSSSNMEEIAYYLQYLKALPTLRVTRGTAAAQFETTPLLAAMHNEPLCWASGV
jgi:hypothetical protein